MRSVLLLIAILLLAVVGYFVFRDQGFFNNTTTVIPSPTITVSTVPTAPTSGTSATGNYCLPSQLEGKVDPEVAAGNVYATVTLKNISDTTCQIVGTNALEIGYPISVKNFQTVSKGQATTAVFTLEPKQTIYSLLHYANGPQCSSMATDVNAMVSYDISADESVTFTPTMGPTLDIPSCGKVSEKTTIDLYPFSTEVVTP